MKNVEKVKPRAKAAETDNETEKNKHKTPFTKE